MKRIHKIIASALLIAILLIGGWLWWFTAIGVMLVDWSKSFSFF